jgi:hypothetical protein
MNHAIPIASKDITSLDLIATLEFFGNTHGVEITENDRDSMRGEGIVRVKETHGFSYNCDNNNAKFYVTSFDSTRFYGVNGIEQREERHQEFQRQVREYFADRLEETKPPTLINRLVSYFQSD